MKTIKISLVLAALCLYGTLTVNAAFASVNDDQVTSQKIKEADGTSGQNTNSGSGVKTGHIQDGAVTTDKIADGTVVTNKVVDGAVTTPKITDGAVTDSKISGVISGTKIGTHTHIQSQVTGLEAALAGKSDVTHNHDALYQQKYGKMAFVAQTGGDYTNPSAAMNDVASWCGIPSASNPCLIKIMAGVYDVSSNSIYMQPYVDMEGSGSNVTILSNSLSAPSIIGATNSELRALTIKSTAPTNTTDFQAAVRFPNVTTRIKDVVVSQTGSGTINTAISVSSSTVLMDNVVAEVNSADSGNIAINNLGSVLTLKNVTAIATGGNQTQGIVNGNGATVVINNSAINSSGAFINYGIFNFGNANSVLLNNTEVNANLGIMNNNAQGMMIIRNSAVNGAVVNNGTGMQIKIGQSQITGELYPGIYYCFGVYNADYSGVTCP